MIFLIFRFVLSLFPYAKFDIKIHLLVFYFSFIVDPYDKKIMSCKHIIHKSAYIVLVLLPYNT